MGTLLGLDLSASSTGYAIVPVGTAPAGTALAGPPRLKRPIVSGAHSFRNEGHRLREGNRLGPTYLRYSKWLGAMIADHEVEVIYFEAPLPQKDRRREHANTALLQLGMTAVTELVAEIRGLGPHLFAVDVQTLKKFWAGHGRAEKADMIRMVELTCGFRPATSDEADAVAVAEYGLVTEMRRARGAVHG
jgi:Holliday junction resolvasome RuvABC endonuclease subunit